MTWRRSLYWCRHAPGRCAARMTGQGRPSPRTAAALERLAPRGHCPDRLAGRSHAYVWSANGAREVAAIEAPRLDLLQGIDAQKERDAENIARLAAGPRRARHAAVGRARHGQVGTGALGGARGAGRPIRAGSRWCRSAPTRWTGSPACSRCPERRSVTSSSSSTISASREGDEAGPRHLRSVA